MGPQGDAVVVAKRSMRSTMRSVRRNVPDQAGRSERLWSVVSGLSVVRSAATLMAFTSVPGEPDTATFIGWCRAHGKWVLLPEPAVTAPVPDDAASVDVVVVPGLAFTPDGRRLGQGGGWYDRVLVQVRPGAVAIGVCFAAQLVDDLPTEDHDVRLDLVVTEDGIAGRPCQTSDL